MTQKRRLRKRVFALLAGLCLALPAAGAAAQELRLAAPPEMAASGFLGHLLPRFKIKHRIAVAPVPPGAEAEMSLRAGGGQGVQVFAGTDGTGYRLQLIARTPETETFLAWLQSGPGKAAITGFPRGGPPAYSTELAVEAAVAAPEITGDTARGASLALQHCGRCHVVDQRNRMGGIGSTPSFAAMRARPHWFDLFSKYWTENPHPSFTEVIGVTEPFSVTKVSHIAPVRITPQDIEAIVAFVETLEPLDLGRPVTFD